MVRSKCMIIKLYYSLAYYCIPSSITVPPALNVQLRCFCCFFWTHDYVTGPLSVSDLTKLGHLDQYHYGGIEANDHVIQLLGIDETVHCLDVGSGIGGPGRYIASKTGCRVTGVELQADICKAGQILTDRVPELVGKSSVQNWWHHCSVQKQRNPWGELWPFLVSFGFSPHPRQRSLTQGLLWCHEERWHLSDRRLCSKARSFLFWPRKGWAFECCFGTNSDYSGTVCAWSSESRLCRHSGHRPEWAMAKVDKGPPWPVCRVEDRDCQHAWRRDLQFQAEVLQGCDGSVWRETLPYFAYVDYSRL